MTKTTIIKKELNVPTDAMFAVAEIIADNEIDHTIVGVDQDEETITIEVQYSKGDREFIHEMENIIEDHTAEDEEVEEE